MFKALLRTFAAAGALLAVLAGPADAQTSPILNIPTLPTIATASGYGLPTSPDTLVGRAATQTLTNKTFVAPALGAATAASLALTNPGLSGTFTGSGLSALFALNQSGAAASATSPEIGAQFTMTSNVGLANSATAFKIGLTSSVVGGANSASIYPFNSIATGYAGPGGYLVTGNESDINNIGANAPTLGGSTAAYGFVSVSGGTFNPTSAYWATAVGGTHWYYGYAANGLVDTPFYAGGTHVDGLNLAGSFSGNQIVGTGFNIAPTGVGNFAQLKLSGTQVATVGGGYNILFDNAANQDIVLGGTADPTNYYNQTSHAFRSSGGGTTYATISATAFTTPGIQVNTVAGANHVVAITGSNGGNPVIGTTGGLLNIQAGGAVNIGTAFADFLQVSGGASTVTLGTNSGTLTLAPNVILGGGLNAPGVLATSNTTASTSTTTGAITSGGGGGFVGSVYAAGYGVGSTVGLASKTCTINTANAATGITITITGGIITGTTTC